jgi:hypothetical protein
MVRWQALGAKQATGMAARRVEVLTNAVAPKMAMCEGSGMLSDWPSVWPFVSSARTAKKRGSLCSWIAVSKPWGRRSVTRKSFCRLAPPRTSHDATWVSPFQLAYTFTLPSAAGTAASAGGLAGCPVQP